MNNTLLIVLILAISFILTWAFKSWAIKKAIIDLPNERSSHSTPTPRGGGIAIVLSFYLGLSFLYLNNQLDKNLLYALLPGLVLAFIGFADDFKNLSPVIRFTTQIICSGIALYFLGGFHGPFGDNLVWLWNLIALVGFVWFINLFNFLDGSDGYASMEGISISLALWFFTGMNVMLLLAFSISGFFYWNWPRAKIFMGDAGSTTLGYMLIVFGIYAHNHISFNFLLWLIITALFWFDATITLARRIINKEKLTVAHRNHMYQRAILGGFSHLKTMLWGLTINIILFIICFTVWKEYCPVVSGFMLMLIILWLVMKYVDKKFAFLKPVDRS